MALAYMDELREILGSRLLLDPDVVAAYSQDRATFLRPEAPAAVALAHSTDEVAAIMRVCSAAGVAVVPRGAGTGLAGGANAIRGCLVLCVAQMDRILDIDPANMLAVVQPGVINADLKKAVAEQGLEYPPDPSSFEICSIGGNVATNAGGLCCVRYGVTRDYVLGLEVVLADGTVLRTGRRTMKGVAGYDLTALIVGSEGTLAVVTEVTVRLRPKGHPPSTMVAFFPTLEESGAAIAAIRRAMVPSMLELMDQRTVAAVEGWKHLGLDTDAAAMVLAQADTGSEAATEVAFMAGVCEEEGASSVVSASDEFESRMLVQARRLAIPAIEQRGSWLLDDIGVPCARVPDLLRRVERIAELRETDTYSFGHAGDGNMHPTMVFDPLDPVARERAELALDDIVYAALDLGGTCTGEHGVGLLKRRHLGREVGADSLALQRRIKASFDPQGILNPGKAL
ncbi:MAG TPA: FAD-linked oxidase C-terminal domain-containing protein [Candidatus Dormibacteraeota bacterium]|nr:FAD-linked oxidase C-terminal domain-containing protein [Candidatus Dormibacteraeota bacterium]